jgi:hypothetical protein
MTRLTTVLAAACLSLVVPACAASTEDAGADVESDSAAFTGNNCKLSVSDPSIRFFNPNGTVLETVPGSNPVGAPVLELLKTKGFKLTSEDRAAISMDTEVRCSKIITFFGFQDSCQTEVRFVKINTDRVLHRSRTFAGIGMNIDFNGITFPECKDLH